jgi:hypothetical protein
VTDALSRYELYLLQCCCIAHTDALSSQDYYDASEFKCEDGYTDRDCRECDYTCPEGQVMAQPCTRTANIVCAPDIGKCVAYSARC